MPTSASCFRAACRLRRERESANRSLRVAALGPSAKPFAPCIPLKSILDLWLSKKRRVQRYHLGTPALALAAIRSSGPLGFGRR